MFNRDRIYRQEYVHVHHCERKWAWKRTKYLYKIVIGLNHCYTVQTFSITKTEQNRTELLNCADRRSENDSLLMERKLYHCLEYFPYLRIIFLHAALLIRHTNTQFFSNTHFISLHFATHKNALSHTHSIFLHVHITSLLMLNFFLLKHFTLNFAQCLTCRFHTS